MMWEKMLLKTPVEVKLVAAKCGYVHLHRTRNPQNGTHHWVHVMNATAVCSDKERCAKVKVSR